MELSSLFPVVDERATAKKVKKFFEKDFERLLRLADEQISFFRSPNYDGMPKSPSTINGQEESAIKYIVEFYWESVVSDHCAFFTLLLV